MTEMKWWITWVHSEKEAGIVLKKEMAAKAAAESEWRKSFATRIMRYGENLIDNFNGTGYRFAKDEKFIGITYNVIRPEMNYWSYY
jgi:hypothetical protein